MSQNGRGSYVGLGLDRSLAAGAMDFRPQISDAGSTRIRRILSSLPNFLCDFPVARAAPRPGGATVIPVAHQRRFGSSLVTFPVNFLATPRLAIFSPIFTVSTLSDLFSTSVKVIEIFLESYFTLLAELLIKM